MNRMCKGSLVVTVVMITAAFSSVLGLLTMQYRAVAAQVALSESAVAAKYAALSGLVAVSADHIAVPVVIASPSATAADLRLKSALMARISLPIPATISAAVIGPNWVAIATVDSATVMMTCASGLSPQDVLRQAKKIL